MLSKIDEKAVSPVIGVILLVAITVVLSAVVFLLVTGLTDDVDTEVITIGIKQDGDEYVVTSAPSELLYENIVFSGCTVVMRGSLELTGTDEILSGDRFVTCDSPLVISYENKLIYDGT